MTTAKKAPRTPAKKAASTKKAAPSRPSAARSAEARPVGTVVPVSTGASVTRPDGRVVDKVGHFYCLDQAGAWRIGTKEYDAR